MKIFKRTIVVNSLPNIMNDKSNIDLSNYLRILTLSKKESAK